jgi:hypothetical protein
MADFRKAQETRGQYVLMHNRGNNSPGTMAVVDIFRIENVPPTARNAMQCSDHAVYLQC